MDALAILASLMKLLTEPAGEALLNRVFVDHNMSVDSVQKIVAGLKSPPPLPPVGTDTLDTKH